MSYKISRYPIWVESTIKALPIRIKRLDLVPMGDNQVTNKIMNNRYNSPNKDLDELSGSLGIYYKDGSLLKEVNIKSPNDFDFSIIAQVAYEYTDETIMTPFRYFRVGGPLSVIGVMIGLASAYAFSMIGLILGALLAVIGVIPVLIGNSIYLKYEKIYTYLMTEDSADIKFRHYHQLSKEEVNSILEVAIRNMRK